jgi:methionine synthase II (cobalamin-independent)
MPQSISLAAGIVDEASYGIEPVRKIRERTADWARVVGEERLWISPSCGFGRHPARDVPVLRAKMENMVEAAASV